ncbi:MAG: hypothetical protein KH452_01080 [Clostridiales bacterium]|nr:hypothetical protein [Clostridiales bacterium]
MRYKSIWKETKRILAFIIAMALFFHGWSDYGLPVQATEELTVEELTVQVLDLSTCTIELMPDSDTTYTGSRIEPGIVVKNADGEVVEESLYTVSYGENVNAGEGTVTVKAADGNSDVEGEQTQDFPIKKKPLTEEMVTIEPESAVYTGNPHQVTVKVEDGGNTPTYTVAPDPLQFIDKGEHKIAVTGEENYTGTIERIFAISYDPDITEAQVVVDGAVQVGDIWYFSDKASITAAEGYELVDGDFEVTGDRDNVEIKVKNSASGKIGEVSLGDFRKDMDTPTVNLEIEYENAYPANAPEWARAVSSASFSAEDTASGVKGIYYTTDPKVPDIQHMTEWKAGDPLELQADTTYYYCAEDWVGNQSLLFSVKTLKLDAEAPTITVKEGETVIENGNTVYYNKQALEPDGKKSFTVMAEDEGAGFDPAGVSDREFAPGAPETSETKTISSSVSDYIQNTAEHTFTVVYDVDAPVIQAEAITGTDQDSILTNQDVEIKAEVKEQNLSRVELVNTADASDVTAMVLQDPSGNVYGCTISADEYLKKTCRVRAYDLAGNEAEGSRPLTVEIDKAAPELKESDISTDQEANAAGWVNQDATFTITIENDHNSSAEPFIEYKKEAQAQWTKLAGTEIDGQWKFELPEADDTYKGKYQFRTGDKIPGGAVLNVSDQMVEREFKKDKVSARKDNIQVEYKAYSQENVTNQSTKGLFSSLITGIQERFFAKTKIEAILYIQDQISGVQTIEFTYGTKDDDEGIVSGTAEVDANAAAEIDGEGYSIIPVTAEVRGEHAGVLTITRIVDQAGNETVGAVEPSVVAEGTTILVVDSVPPTIAAEYPVADSEEAEGSRISRRYYRPKEGRTQEEVKLTFTEAYYEKNVDVNGESIKPQITVSSSAEGELADCASWGTYADRQIAAGLNLPYDTVTAGGAEIEYEIRAAYEDGSANKLVLADHGDLFISGNEVYQSGTVVLDNKAPVLTGFQIAGETDRQVNGVDVYHNAAHKEDVQISFAIDDNEAYWNAGAVSVQIINKTTKEQAASLTGDCLKWETDGRIHRTELGFDGMESPAEYEVQVAYTDRAGNGMIGTDVDAGTFTGSSFILDRTAPVFDISYNEAYRLVKNGQEDPSNDRTKSVPVTGYTAYYGEDIQVSFSLNEHYALPKMEGGRMTGLLDYVLEITKDGSPVVLPSVVWSRNGNVYEGSFTLAEEGRYVITMRYKDAAANQMTAGQVQGSSMAEGVKDGSYTSTLLVLDKTAPVIQTSYVDVSGRLLEPENIYGRTGRRYFDEAAVLRLQIEDNNVRYHEPKEELKKLEVFDSRGTRAPGSNAEAFIEALASETVDTDGILWEIPLSAEANYNIPATCEDLAGNKTVLGTEYASVDRTEPELTLSYQVSPSGFQDAVNYKDLGYLFADSKMTITTAAEDKTAGIHIIRYTIKDEHGKVSVREISVDPAAGASHETAVPLETADFKGTVKAEVFDWSQNMLEKSRGHIVESAEKHSSTGSAVITTHTDPSRTVGGKDFYNTDVRFNLTLKDTYSGLRSYTYRGGSTLSGSMDYAKEAGSGLDGDPKKAITYEYSEDMTLLASSNNENDVKVEADFTDNTNHTGHVEQLYNIDVTDPVITVEYDLNDPANERFYRQTRTATVTIRERNFDEGDVNFTITNTDGIMPSISGWKESGSGDDTKHECSVVFQADGDYTFTVAFEDMAGNKADYDRVDEFTVDQTVPELTVTYDNHQNQNDYYYAKGRTATIDILEHNFDPALIQVAVTASGAGVPSVSGWSRNGDHNVATVTFRADADYTFDISGMDQAENPMEEYEQDRFVVDQTAPELEIFDIEHMSANNGIVMPGIRYSDTNYDANGSVILMKGYKNGVQEMNGVKNHTANGMEIKLNDFEHVPEVDDIYTMEASVKDLAGNQSEASVIFSVNRFGSVYTFDDATERLVGANGRYYTNEEQDIVVTETNVDTLEFREITCNLNGNLRTMVEGEDYSVSETGTDVSWKQYTYMLDESNFAEEGTYILTIYSEDRAANTSDNHTKGKKIEFVVDKTSPSILISGVENDGQYRENSREVTLDVQDNIRLADVKVTVDGKETVYEAAKLSDLDGKIIFTIDSANHWQNMTVEAFDAAGNEQGTEELRFLITSNILVQFFMNKTVFYGALAVLAVLGGGIWWFLFAAKRKEREV